MSLFLHILASAQISKFIEVTGPEDESICMGERKEGSCDMRSNRYLRILEFHVIS